MSNYFTEVSRDTFLISFKSKVDENKFFKYVEKNFQKWGMVDIDYDKKEKTIIGKSPAIALSFWSKFPVKLSTVGLKSIIISKGDQKNSFLINVNTNEIFGNSHTVRFPSFFSKEINTKFAKVINHNQTVKESENLDLEHNIKEKKTTKNKKLTAEEKITNVKKKNPSKMIWWISGAVGFVILLMVLGSGGNNSGSNSQTYSFSSKRIVCTGGGCVIKCSYSGSRLDAWTKWYDDGYHVRLPRWGCPLRIDQDGYPAR